MNFKFLLIITIWFFSFFAFFIGYLNYKDGYSFVFNLIPVINYIALHPFAMVLFTVALLFVIFIQYKVYKRNLLLRKNCQIQYLELEKIAISWLDNVEIEENIANMYKNMHFENEDKAKEDALDILNVFLSKNISNTSFITTYITPYIHSFSKMELDIILTLMEILEKQAKNLPSVATLFVKKAKDGTGKEKETGDSDIVNYKGAVSIDGKTSYDILMEVTLYDHTMRVVSNTFDIIESKHQDNFMFFLPKALIIALGHDIGKIQAIKQIQDVKDLANLIYHNTTHEKMSKFILDKMFPEYEYIDDVGHAIESHHLAMNEKTISNFSFYAKLLKEADEASRNEEIKEYQKNVKKLDRVNKKTELEPKEESDIENQGVLVSKSIMPQTVRTKQKNTKSKQTLLPIEDDVLSIPEIQTIFISEESLGMVINEIRNSANTVEKLKNSGKVKPLSISLNDGILYVHKDYFLKLLKKQGIDIGNSNDVEKTMERIKEDGLLIIRGKEMFIKNSQEFNSFKPFTFMGLSIEALGFTQSEMDLIKRNEPLLRNIVLETA